MLKVNNCLCNDYNWVGLLVCIILIANSELRNLDETSVPPPPLPLQKKKFKKMYDR